MAWRYAGDDEHAPGSFSQNRAALLGVLREPLFLTVCGLLMVWSFNPVWGSVLYLHMTQGLGFSEQSVGNVTSAFFAGSLLGSVGLWHLLSLRAACHPAACFHYSRHRLQCHLLAVEQLELGLCRLNDRRSRLHDRHADSIGPGCARHTDTRSRTLFAIVMALTNLAASGSEAFGAGCLKPRRLHTGRRRHSLSR